MLNEKTEGRLSIALLILKPHKKHKGTKGRRKLVLDNIRFAHSRTTKGTLRQAQ